MFDRGKRRREAVDEALHELRRPLQALALAPAARRGEDEERFGDLVWMATEALARLDRALDGAPDRVRREPFRPRLVLDRALVRWGPRAELGGGSLALRWLAEDPVAVGDPAALARALDNLIVNALEHGGPRVVVTACAVDGTLRVTVADSGRREVRGPAPGEGRERRRRGHGLRIVGQIAAAHGGRFELRRGATGAEAVLELPLPDGASRQ